MLNDQTDENGGILTDIPLDDEDISKVPTLPPVASSSVASQRFDPLQMESMIPPQMINIGNERNLNNMTNQFTNLTTIMPPMPSQISSIPPISNNFSQQPPPLINPDELLKKFVPSSIIKSKNQSENDLKSKLSNDERERKPSPFEKHLVKDNSRDSSPFSSSNDLKKELSSGIQSHSMSHENIDNIYLSDQSLQNTGEGKLDFNSSMNQNENLITTNPYDGSSTSIDKQIPSEIPSLTSSNFQTTSTLQQLSSTTFSSHEMVSSLNPVTLIEKQILPEIPSLIGNNFQPISTIQQQTLSAIPPIQSRNVSTTLLKGDSGEKPPTMFSGYGSSQTSSGMVQPPFSTTQTAIPGMLPMDGRLPSLQAISTMSLNHSFNPPFEQSSSMIPSNSMNQRPPIIDSTTLTSSRMPLGPMNQSLNKLPPTSSIAPSPMMPLGLMTQPPSTIHTSSASQPPSIMPETTINQPPSMMPPSSSNEPLSSISPLTMNQSPMMMSPSSTIQSRSMVSEQTSNQPKRLMGQVPPTNVSIVPGQPPITMSSNSFGESPNMMPRSSTNQPPFKGATNSVGQAAFPMQQTTLDQPPMMPPGSMNQSLNIIPPGSLGQPPTMMPQSGLNQPSNMMPPGPLGQPSTMMPPGSMSQPSTMMPPGPLGQPSTMMPPGTMGQPPNMMPPGPLGQPPTMMPQSGLNQPPNMMPPGSMNQPPLIIPPGSMSQPPTMMPPGSTDQPLNMMPPGPLCQPPIMMPQSGLNQPPNMMPPGSMSQPPTMMPPGPLGQPPTMMPPGTMGQPPTMMPPGPLGQPPSLMPLGGMNQPPSMMPPQISGMQPNQIVQPGIQTMPPSMGGMNQPGNQQFNQMGGGVPQSSGPKLSMMPDKLLIEEDNRLKHGENELFRDDVIGNVPPLVTTNFKYTSSRGRCHPAFMRCSTYVIPTTPDISRRMDIPICTVVSPFASVDDYQIPLINCGADGPVRCKRCKAYMAPQMQFIDGGQRFHCVWCDSFTDVPNEYFNHLDHTGCRIDKWQRAELCCGSFEYTTNDLYKHNNRKGGPTAYLFMIDCGQESIQKGLLGLIAHNLFDQILAQLPKDSNEQYSKCQIAIVTYDTKFYFYKLTKGYKPQVIIVNDLEDVFIPLCSDLFVDLNEHESDLRHLLQQLPEMFINNKENKSMLSPVLQIVQQAFSSTRLVGRAFIFHTNLPTMDLPGKLDIRDNKHILGTEKEKTILVSATNEYKKLGEVCVDNGVGINMYLFPKAYVDIATLKDVTATTGGEIRLYSDFQVESDGEQFLIDLQKNIKKRCVYDAILRLRTSPGIRPVDFLGNHQMYNSTDVNLAIVDESKAVTIVLKHDDKLSEEQEIYLQAALLYTDFDGERKIRIHNQILKASSAFEVLYAACDVDVITNYLLKSSIKCCLETSPKILKDELIKKVSNIFTCYRKECSRRTSLGSLILPDTMKTLPLFTCCILRSNAFGFGNTITVDSRSELMTSLMASKVYQSNHFLYPNIYIVTSDESEKKNERKHAGLSTPEQNGDDSKKNNENEKEEIAENDFKESDLPPRIRCNYESMKNNEIYLLENGYRMYLWIGTEVEPKYITDIFGVKSLQHVQLEMYKRLPKIGNDISIRLNNMIDFLNYRAQRSMKFSIVKQREGTEGLFRNMLVEDQGIHENSTSYVQFLCSIHAKVRSAIN
ncbi:hypothetical protein SNEBB_010895 [Seison nebaliae]|nr:hypothetical protein SNEBB_010895 [Seison nebaliae]